MKEQATFTGWDFTDTWCIAEHAVYPQLKWRSSMIQAHHDNYTLSAYGTLTVAAPGVLANDNDSLGMPSAYLVSGTYHGTLKLHADGSFTYTPPSGFSGTDNFTYSAGGCDNATVTITVAECSFTIGPTGDTFLASGGDGEIAVSASGGKCPRTAASDSDWIHITSGASAKGTGIVEYTVLENTGAARTAAITIAGETCTITQDAASPTTTTTVPDNGTSCDLTVFPKKLHKLLGIAAPLKGYILIGKTDSTLACGDTPQWCSDAIQPVLDVQLGPRIIISLVLVRPFELEPGECEVGLCDCTGTIEIKGF